MNALVIGIDIGTSSSDLAHRLADLQVGITQ